MKKPFAKGYDPRRAPGGARKNAGRHPDWFRQACREAIEENKGIEFASDVLAGKEFPQLATGDGEVLPLPPSLKDRFKALEWLTDRGFGKAEQSVEVSGSDGAEFAALPASALIEIVAALTAGTVGSPKS